MNDTIIIILSFTLPFILTTLGAALIFCFSKPSKLLNLLTIGLASGIMFSASIWSLLVPALEEAENLATIHPLIPVAIGFVGGAILMFLFDLLCKPKSNTKKNNKKIKKTIKNLEKTQQNTQTTTSNSQNLDKIENKDNSQAPNFPTPTEKHKAFKLFTAITIHNIPEGLAVGFAVGTALATGNPLFSAFMFALGISLQNFPEGLATSLPIKNCLNSKKKGFIWGALSGIVEPIFAIIGFFLATQLTFLLPWLLSISAGAMIYVTVEELLPEILNENKSNLGTWAFVAGFLLMMTLDICL